MTDLDLIPTEDLLKALKRRFDHMVFAACKDMGGDRGKGLQHPPSLDNSFARR